MVSRKSSAVVGAALLTVALAAPAMAQDPTVEVLADGLNDPRGVSVGSDGSIYVAEAGVGGDDCLGEDFGGMCYGPTGAILQITADGAQPVVEGLPSVASPQEPGAGGVSDVTVAADGTLYLIMNLGADPAARAGFPEALADAGWLLKAGADGATERVADVAAFESENDPDAEMGGEVDSNPYGLVATDDGIVVADAGGNDILLVGDDGSVSLLGVIAPTVHEFSAAALAAMGAPPEGEGEVPAASGEAPDASAEAPAEDQMVPVPVQAVPTSVAVGPDGAIYVGQLTGGPFPVGGASVWRLADGEAPTEYASGFTNIMGLGFAPDGTLYVAEMVHEGLMTVFAGGDTPPIGAVLSVPLGGGEPTIVATGEQLMALGGLAVDSDGAIYVSTGTVMGPGGGAVVKITP